MSEVRVLREDDVPAAVELFERVYPQHRWRSRLACQDYFREILFANPWRDADLPSWAVEDGDRLCGLYAVLPRRMQLHGRALRVAVGCQFMVDAGSRRSLVSLQLARACLAGPQDLTLADGASDLTRRLWSSICGTASLLHSLHWTRPLRPACYALSLLERRAVLPRLLARAAQALGAIPDALAARLPANRMLREMPQPADEALGAEDMLAQLPAMLRGTALQPVYDAATLSWLLEQAGRKTRHGALRARLVRAGGQVIGWYLYYLRPGAAAEVLQVAALERRFERVLAHMLADAWRRGASAAHGRLDPRYAQELSARHCWFRWDNTWTLLHTRDPAIAAAIHAGDAHLSRLEGEWWLRFLDEDSAVRAPATLPAAPRARAGSRRAAAGAP
jgi:GNAT acetyltransferase-like protein